MQIDRLTIEILEDGTIKTSTDAVSAANHDNAEQFLRAMAHLAGDTWERIVPEGDATASYDSIVWGQRAWVRQNNPWFLQQSKISSLRRTNA